MMKKLIDKARGCFNYKTRYQTIVIPNLGVMNRNSRIYTREIAHLISGSFFDKMLGQIGHPEDGMGNLKNVSHIIHRIFLVGNDLWAEYSIIDSDHGRLLYDLLQNHDFVLRPRGVGTVHPDGTIGDDFQILSFDFIPCEDDSFLMINKSNNGKQD